MYVCTRVCMYVSSVYMYVLLHDLNVCVYECTPVCIYVVQYDRYVCMRILYPSCTKIMKQVHNCAVLAIKRKVNGSE